MTEQQDKLVTDHHHLIVQCMKICKIPPKYQDDYYGDAAIGLCEAAINFLNENGDTSEFHQYARTVIINKIKNAREFQLRKKRFADEVPIHKCEYVKDEVFENNFNSRFTFEAIYGLLYIEEQKILEMVLSGYTYQEIGNAFGISKQAVNNKLKNAGRRIINTNNLAVAGA